MLLGEKQIAKEDIVHLSNTIKVITSNFKKLDKVRQLTAVNLIMKLCFTRRINELIIPPLEDLK